MRQKLKAKEWDELLAKGKRFRVLQPVQVGCVWAAEAANCAGSDLKLLQQFTACLLDAAPPEDQEPKASRREKRDQHSKWGASTLDHGACQSVLVEVTRLQADRLSACTAVPSYLWSSSLPFLSFATGYKTQDSHVPTKCSPLSHTPVLLSVTVLTYFKILCQCLSCNPDRL